MTLRLKNTAVGIWRFVPKCGTNHNDDAMIDFTAFGAVHIYQQVKQ